MTSSSQTSRQKDKLAAETRFAFTMPEAASLPVLPKNVMCEMIRKVNLSFFIVFRNRNVCIYRQCNTIY